MKKSESDDCYVAQNAEELLFALQCKAPYILITKYYKEEFMENTEIPMPEENLFSLTNGAASVGGNPIFLLMNRFSKKNKQQRKIDAKIQKYILKEHDEDLLLHLRLLDY